MGINVPGDSKKFHGGGMFAMIVSTPESEIEIELERTWEASTVDLERVWTQV